MSFEGMLVQDVYVLRAGVMVDRYNDALPDWDNATSTPTKAWIYQRNSEEEHGQGRDAHLQEWRAYVRYDADVSAKDRIVWPIRGLTFEVDGPPRASYRPTGSGPQLHHLECDLKHVAG